MNKTTIAASMFFAALVAVFISLAVRPAVTGGSSAGPDHYNQENFIAGLTSAFEIGGTNGGVDIASSSTSTVLTAAQVCGGQTILWTPNVNNSTATLPDTASLVSQCLLKPGYWLDVQFRSKAATNTFNVVAGAGQTVYHIYQASTSSLPGLSITSSTPTWFRIRITLASGTDSTASVLETKYQTP